MLPELDSRKMALLLAFAIALVALFAYGDFFGIELMEFDAIPKLVSHSQASADEFFSILTGPEQNYLPISSNYRPFGSLILWLMFMFTGLNFTAFHALNFALHAINSVLVFFLAKRLIKGNMFPFLAALVFALHPIHLNTVLFVSRMHELLACFALLSSLLLLMKFLEKRKQHYFLASILFCAIGIFSKEAGSLIPFVLFACCLIFLKEKNIRSLTLKSLRICFPFFALVAAYFALMLFSLGSLAGYAYSLDYTKSQVVFSFLQFLFCPINFLSASIPSQFNAFLSNPLANTLFLLFFIGLSIFSLKFFSGKEQDRQVLFLLCWFLTFIFAFTALNALAVWYSYIPAVPFSILLTVLLQRSLEKFNKTRLSKAASALIALLIISLILFSPIFIHYRQPLVAAGITKTVLEQATCAASGIPAQSSIYLLNFPEFLSLKENGFNYPIILVNQHSVQAMLDLALPEKQFNVVSLTTSTVLAFPLPENQFVFQQAEGCDFTIENTGNSKAEINLSMQLTQGEIVLPEQECETAFFLFFNGQNVEAIKAGNR